MEYIRLGSIDVNNMESGHILNYLNSKMLNVKNKAFVDLKLNSFVYNGNFG